MCFDVVTMRMCFLFNYGSPWSDSNKWIKKELHFRLKIHQNTTNSYFVDVSVSIRDLHHWLPQKVRILVVFWWIFNLKGLPTNRMNLFTGKRIYVVVRMNSLTFLVISYIRRLPSSAAMASYERHEVGMSERCLTSSFVNLIKKKRREIDNEANKLISLHQYGC